MGSQITRPLILAAVFALTLAIWGCGSPGSQPHSLSHAPLQAQDDFGQLVKLSHPPQRIICLTPNTVEILYALGLGDHIAGVVEFSDYPPEAKKKTLVGRHDRPSLEKIVSLRPDLVLMGFGNPREFLQSLQSANIPVFGANPKTVADIFSIITRLGQLCGVPERAKQLTAQLTSRLEKVKAQLAQHPAPRPRVFIVIDPDGLWTAGAHTLQDEILRLAGGTNVASIKSSYYPFSKEALLAAQPDIILLTAKANEAQKVRQQILARPDLSTLTAIKQKKIIIIDPDAFSRPGPRIITAIEQLAALLAPH